MFQTLSSTRTENDQLVKLTLLAGRNPLEGDFTFGSIYDEDTILIKASASQINLSEQGAINLVDKIRESLPMNK